MNVENELRKRFAKVVKKLVKPPVLFGQKWVRPSPTGPPGQFQFVGTSKLAKATGIDIHRLVKRVLERVRLEDLGLTAKATATGVITLTPTKKAGKKTPPEKKEKKPDKKKPAAGKKKPGSAKRPKKE